MEIKRTDEVDEQRGKEEEEERGNVHGFTGCSQLSSHLTCFLPPLLSP